VRKKFEEKRILLSFELLEFLKGWLAHHIMETDKKYGAALAGKEVP
jgi:hemerythrin